MKLTITKSKFFVFCVINILAINIGVAQNTSLDSLTNDDSHQIENNDDILTTPFGVFNLKNTVGNVFRISGDVLRQTAGDNLSEALRGRVPGLRIFRGTNTPNSTGSYGYLLNGGSPFILIDGQPRGLQVDLREVEEVIVLSDATFNSLLGNLGDNGLIYVRTKGGTVSKPVVEVNYQQSINLPTRQPRLLSAADYANVINRASNNDGLGDIYSPQDIEAYKTGSDPINFPNVDYQDTFIEDFSQSNFASLNVYGGTENVIYSAFLGYSDWEGLEKVGTKIEGRNITFRTKIEAKLNDILTAKASVYGKFGENDRPNIGPDDTFRGIVRTPANAYPLKVGDTAYIVSNQFNSNLLSSLEAGGSRTDFSSNMIFDIALDFDFNKYVKGLTYNTYAMMRTFNSHSLRTTPLSSLYTIENLVDSQQQDSLALKLFRSETPDITIGRTGAVIARNFVYGGNVNYMKEINEGILNLNLNHLLYFIPNTTASQPDRRNITLNLNASYTLKNTYTVYANMNSSSSTKFLGNNKTKILPTVGAAWTASNEDFLTDNKVIDYLKFNASHGVVATEYTASNFYYYDTWSGGRNNNTTYLGAGNTAQDKFGYRLSNTGNEDIDWVLYNQTFAGFEVGLLKKLRLNFNYFDIKIDDQVVKAGQEYADALGSDTYLPQLNFQSQRNRGFNTNLTFNNSNKSFNYYVNVNAGYNKRTNETISEVQHLEEYRLGEGRASDIIRGYVSDGLFTADNIDSALPQFGDVQIGDVKYVDQNGDNLIDSRDQTVIGNSTPRFNYGVSVGFEYKGVNLDIVGMGVGGYDLTLNTRDYYTHGGLDQYYASVNSDLPNGNANPRLSTIASTNNNRTSDYWLVDGSYFRISNVELGYTLPKYIFPGTNVKLFLRGSNLAIFSKLKDLDPEDTSSGRSEYPMMRSFVLGASVNF